MEPTTYDMTESFEKKGYWWTSANPNQKAAGTLTYSPSNGLLLELIGLPGSNKEFWQILESKENINLYGTTTTEKEISLFNCHAWGTIHLNCSFSVQKFSCQYAVIGKLLDSFEQECFFSARITIPILSHWCPPHLLSQEFREDNSTLISTKEQPETINCAHIEPGITLTLKSEIKSHRDTFLIKIEQSTSLFLQYDKDASLSRILQDVHLFCHFLSFATLQNVAIEEIILKDKNAFQEFPNGHKFYDSINIIYSQKELARTKKFDEFLFHHATIKTSFSNVIKKWYSANIDLAPIRQHLIECIKHKNTFTSIDFLLVIQALEGFSYRFRKEKESLFTLLANLYNEFQDVGIPSINIKQAVDSRHYYSHFMPKTKKPNTLDGIELYNLTHNLRILLICCLLNFIGFDNTQIKSIITKSNSFFTKNLEE